METGIEPPDKLPPGATVVWLQYVSKTGFSGPTVSSLIYGLIGRDFQTCLFRFMGDNSVVGGRNAAAIEAVTRGAEYLFFVDSDMDFPVGTLTRLKACDADIACADMWSRSVPSFRTVLRYGAPDGKKKQLVPYEGMGVQDIDCCGMACTLIRVSLLEKFAKKKLLPFFMGVHGEDAAFCMVAKQKFKASMKCDFDITAGHWGQSRMAGQEWTRDANNAFGGIKALADANFLKRMGVRNIPGPGDQAASD